MKSQRLKDKNPGHLLRSLCLPEAEVKIDDDEGARPENKRRDGWVLEEQLSCGNDDNEGGAGQKTERQ